MKAPCLPTKFGSGPSDGDGQHRKGPQGLWRGRDSAWRLGRHRGWRVRRSRRPVRLRKIDTAAHDRRIEDISGGTISIGGRVVNDLPPKERDISMVFQNYALYPHMTVAENMAFSMTLAGAPKAEKARRVADAAQILGLTPLLERYPRQLSGGQRQRVAMGRAIVRDPQVFLFDEPLSNLDAKLARCDARRDQEPASSPDHHDGLRHPRSGRGHDHGRPDRRDERRAGSSRSARRSISTTIRKASSLPALLARHP
jgi:hypothetical protein